MILTLISLQGFYTMMNIWMGLWGRHDLRRLEAIPTGILNVFELKLNNVMEREINPGSLSIIIIQSNRKTIFMCVGKSCCPVSLWLDWLKCFCAHKNSENVFPPTTCWVFFFFSSGNRLKIARSVYLSYYHRPLNLPRVFLTRISSHFDTVNCSCLTQKPSRAEFIVT